LGVITTADATEPAPLTADQLDRVTAGRWYDEYRSGVFLGTENLTDPEANKNIVYQKFDVFETA
jgi:hypothetical protein